MKAYGTVRSMAKHNFATTIRSMPNHNMKQQKQQIDKVINMEIKFEKVN